MKQPLSISRKNSNYIKAVKRIAKQEWFIWNELADFYVWTNVICKTTRQYLSKLLEDKDKEIYEEYKNLFKKEMEYLKEKNEYVSYKCKARTEYSEKEIKLIYNFEKQIDL